MDCLRSRQNSKIQTIGGVNKNSFFTLSLLLPEDRFNNGIYMENLNDSVDLILSAMNVKNNIYKFIQPDISFSN